MINVKHETPHVLKILSKVEVFIKYNILRPIISFILWKIKPNKENYFLDYNGKPLREGISFCVPAYNEEHTISLCFSSLIGFVQEIIFIDNGSTDNTLQIVQEFQKIYEKQIKVIILEMPESTLVEMRQEALKYVKHKWIIRGDADMLFRVKAKEIILEKIKNVSRPTAFQIRKIELFGTASNYHKLFGKFSKGEFFLRTFDPRIEYIEYYGRLEHAPLPIYCKMTKIKEYSFYHLDCYKENERIIYRTCYLDWREYVNKHPEGQKSKEEYSKMWLQHNFKTNDEKELKYRFARLIGSMCEKHTDSFIAQYPFILKSLIEKDPYIITSKDGKPFLRYGRDEQAFFDSYQLTDSESAWTPDVDKFYRDSIRMAI